MAVIFLLSMIIVRTEVAEDLICNVQRLGGLGAGVVEWCWGGGGGGGAGGRGQGGCWKSDTLDTPREPKPSLPRQVIDNSLHIKPDPNSQPGCMFKLRRYAT